MAKTIEVPGQGLVEFPDSMSDGDIVTAIKKMPAGAPMATPAAAPARASNPRLDKITSYAAETDTLLGLTPGTSLAQLTQESRLRDDATSPVGAEGVAQVMPKTKATLERRLGRPLNSRNTDDALLIHREVMKENIQKFGNRDDALRAYNAGWDKNRWGNPETAAYVDKINGRMGIPAAEGTAYKPFATIRKDIDQKTLNTDPDWLKASALIYELWEKKPYEGKSENDLAEWGKDRLGYFNFNTIDMGRIAYAVSKGSQEQKEAFLYMMDTYDETNISWDGAGRAAKGILTDPLNLVGLGTMGIGFGAKMAARNASKEAAKLLVKQSMLQGVKDAVVTGAVRTGVVAGMEGAIYGGAQSVVKQGVEVSAGRREEISTGKTAVDAATGAAAGLVLGTGLDVVASKALPPAARAVNNIRDMFRGAPDEVAAVTAPAGATPQATPGTASVPPTVAPTGTPGAVPATNNLTPDEIVAAQARQQDGRLPEDQIAPDMTGAPDNLITLPNIENTGGRTTRINGEPVAKVTKADVEAQSQTVVDQLKALSNDDLPIALEQLRTGKFTMEEQRVVASALRLHSDELAVAAKEAIVARDSLLAKPNRTPEEELRLQEVTAKAEEILARMATPSLTDDAFGSMAGTVLSDRRNAGPGASKITVESIMAERGITRDEALTVWAEVTAKLEQEAAIQKVADGYEVRISAARDAGDMDEVAKLSVQKGREMAAMGENIAPGAAGFVDKLKETAISNVFTATTVQINFVASAVKTAITPSLRFVFGNDYSKAARAELAGSYAAMRSSFGSAVAGARTAYRLEQSLLTRDSTRLVDGELALNDSNKLFKWVPAGAIRFLPRVLNSSDEFLSRLAYDSYVSGKAAAEAAIDGAEKGLKGKALDDFIDQASEKALDAARTVAKGEDIIQPVVNKGVNKGLTGDELWDWVEKEVMRNPDALRKGVDEDALAYVRDLLYKREFSGEGRASKLAQLYEKGAKAVPAWALVTGQLFFRTPIRVFEEGVRLTPGLQIVAPGFLDDLAGKNGMARQVKAQAESMTSLAVAGAVISLYSQGRITGDGAYSDFKQGKNRTDGPLQAPYTIKMSDGSTWSYKLFDPLSTPVKIMVNALERADKLRLKQSQGEDIPDSMIEEAYSHVTVGVAAVLTAIKDANLVTGARMTAEIFTNAEDIEKNESRWLKFLGEKMFLLVPNTLHKIAKDNDPSIRDPADFWQMVEEKLARPLGLDGSTKVVTSKAYDILGNVRRPADTGTLWNIFSTSSIEEQTKGMSPESQAIMIETDRLTRTTGATFKAPIKHPSLGDLDLRTVMAADGKRTLYDVWQDNYKALKPEAPLYELAISPLPDGTFKNRGIKAAAMQDIMGKFQEAAFAQLRVEEGDVINAQIDKVLREKALSKSGAFDSKLPY